MAGGSTDDQHLRHLTRLRRVKNRIDRDYAKPPDVEALARAANMSPSNVCRPGNADTVQEPTEQPCGIRDCAVRDPAGAMIRIQELS